MKLLIVSLYSYSLFDTSTQFIFAGAELRSSLFAKELSKLPDVEVTVVTRDHARVKKKFGNVLVVPHPGKKGQGYWEEQKKLSTRIKNKFSGKGNIHAGTFFFDELKPTHALVLGMSPETVEFWKYSKTANIPFIFGCASDVDLSEKFLSENPPVDTSGNDASEYANVIRSASLVLVQSQQQEKMLFERFGRKGILIPNPVASEFPKAVASSISACDVLWVGKTSAFKRPELFLKLAASLPDLRFRMILNNTDSVVWNKLNIEKPANLEIIESVSLEKIEYYFKQTALFVNTSTFEGFPNTFLQAGKFGVPIVSMVIDPDQFITKNKFGILSGDNSESLKNAVQKLLTDPVAYKFSSDSIRTYVMRVHNAQIIAKELLNQISKINPPN